MMPDMMDNMMGGGGFGWLWILVPLLFWGGLLALVAWVLVRIFPGRRADEKSGATEGNAEEILRTRFARGEIDAEEYERSLEVLRGERNATKGSV
jgi:putative membrane protein